MTTFVRNSSTIAFGFKSMENMNIFQMFDYLLSIFYIPVQGASLYI